MKLRLFWYECKNCEIVFKSPRLTGDTYGEFLLLDDHGDMIYLNSLSNPVFDEVKSIFNSMISKKEHDNIGLYLKLFSNVLGLICDPSLNNEIYQVRKPPCPICKKTNIGHFGPTNPSETVDLCIPNATHNAWNKLSIEEKKQRITDVIRKNRNRS